MIREANKNDLDEILQLYLYLHEKSIPEDSQHLRSTWDNIINDANHHLIVCEIDGDWRDYPTDEIQYLCEQYCKRMENER